MGKRPPTEAALLDSKFFDGEFGQLFRIAHAALTHLYDLLADKLSNGVVAINQGELAERKRRSEP